jgi:hypothetical protein
MREETFNPKTRKIISNRRLAPGGTQALTAVTCPSRRQCSAIYANTTTDWEITFDPVSGKPNAAGQSHLGGFGLRALACPSPTQCTGVGDQGQEVTFDPTTGQPSGFATLDLGALLEGISCPSLDQCTTTESRGYELTFDPTTGTVNSAGLQKTSTGRYYNTVDCPTVTQCTIVGSESKEATFNPTTGTGIVAHRIAPRP